MILYTRSLHRAAFLDFHGWKCSNFYDSFVIFFREQPGNFKMSISSAGFVSFWKLLLSLWIDIEKNLVITCLEKILWMLIINVYWCLFYKVTVGLALKKTVYTIFIIYLKNWKRNFLVFSIVIMWIINISWRVTNKYNFIINKKTFK